MPHPVSDAIVFFGATGDLAYKQIFSALQGLMCRSSALDRLKARAKDSLSSHGDLDTKAIAKLTPDGDYNDPSTYVRLRQELKETAAALPCHSSEPVGNAVCDDR
jgi:glucose-6-phosphate 1-dehydrogenase